MHKSLNIIALVGVAAAIAAAPVVALAQDEPAQSAPPTTSEQDAAMQAWPTDKQVAFKTWPAETQAYYWSLSAERQKMFWALADSDKVALSTMAEPQRESTWAQIESRLNPPRN